MNSRQISAPEHISNQPETVWTLQLPKIRFGRGSTEELAHQLQGLGVAAPARGLLVTDSEIVSHGHSNQIKKVLEEAGFSTKTYDDVRREPSVTSIEDCLNHINEVAGEDGFDFYIGLGGGSCMDTAKAVRTIKANDGTVTDYISEPTGRGQDLKKSGAPLILMPTTAGTGSEISPVAIIDVPEKNTKEAIASQHVRADAAVLDPVYSVTLPSKETALIGMDALGQAIEGYITHSFDSLLRARTPTNRPVYAGRTPVTEMYSERAIELLYQNIRRATHNGDDIHARSDMLLGALFGGIAALTAGSNLCHAMSYPVANKWHTYHGETIAVLTPASTFEYNKGSNPARFETIAELFGVDTTGLSPHEAAEAAKQRFIQLQRDLNVVPSGLHELTGATEAHVSDLAERCITQQRRLLRCNPRSVSEDAIADVYRDALRNWE